MSKLVIAFAAVLLTVTAHRSEAAIMEIKNCTGSEFYFVWVSESGRDKWIDMLGLAVLPPDSSALFHVTRGYYDIRIEDSNWVTFSFSRIPIDENTHFVWEVLPVHRDTD